MIRKQKYKTNNLFVASLKVKGGRDNAIEIIICKKKEDYHSSKFIDIITGNTYLNYNDYRTDNGDIVVLNTIPLISAIKSGTFKDEVIKTGYINKNDLIALYNALNSKNGYIITIEKNKNKNNEPKEITILNRKKYNKPPTYLRYQELRQLMISLAMNNKTIVITGENGTGKTALVEQLAYLIQTNEVPPFLKNQLIFEINIPKLKINKKQKEIEHIIEEIISYAKEKDAILFIDDADEILEANENNVNTIALIRYEAEKENVRIITTINSRTFENNSALKDTFDIITLEEPQDTDLEKIGEKFFIDETSNKNISLKIINENLNEIVNILVKSTKSESINYISQKTNPGLLIEIIQNCFAIAQTKNEKSLTFETIIESLNKNNNIENSKKEKATQEIKELQNTRQLVKTKK